MKEPEWLKSHLDDLDELPAPLLRRCPTKALARGDVDKLLGPVKVRDEKKHGAGAKHEGWRVYGFSHGQIK